jgi:hypothetical protein
MGSRPCWGRVRKFASTLIAAAALTAFAAAVTSAAAASPVPALAIADQKPATFSDVRFRALHLRRSRYVAPWNVALRRPDRERFDAWLAAARAAGVRDVLVAFGAASGSHCPRRPCRLPSVGSYTRAFRAFHRRYPQVRAIQPWNEANSPTQPTGPWRRGARAAARYYNAVRASCRRCVVTAADLLDLSTHSMARWLAQFKRYAHGRPLLWGLHNYTDTNRHSGLTRTFLKLVRGKVWLTETGGIVYFRKATGAVNLRYSERRAASALKRMFALASRDRARIARLYVYQWSIDFSGNRFDAGLVRADGLARPGYYVVKHHRGWIR